MAEIRPFRAVRPSAEMASTVAALPYDVYSSDEAREIVKKNPKSFLAIDRAETQFEPGMSPYDDRVYEKAAQMLSDWTADGTFIRDGKPCFFLYELTMDGRSQTGIVGCASIDDYASGVIKKHENTRADKEEDRIRHVDACSAQTGPIFLAYRKNEAISEIVKNIKSNDTPLCDFVSDDGVRHRVFIIEKDDDIKNIAAAFAATENIYIADGHHRAASAVRVGFSRREKNPGFSGDEEFNYFLSVLFPDEELMIMDYNRVVKDLNGLTESEFLGEVRERFDVSRIGEMSCSGEVCEMLPPSTDEEIRPKNKGEFSMYLGGNWYLCKMRPGDVPDDPVGGLDVSVLQERLLAPVLGIGDPRTDDRIDFVGGIRGMGELMRRCETDCAVAFAMHPTSIAELFSVADAGLLMPPKSTWFEPKLRSGLFIHTF